MENTAEKETQLTTAQADVVQENTDRFVRSWEEHINDLKRMKWNLPTKHECDKLDDAIAELNRILKIAVIEHYGKQVDAIKKAGC